MGLVFRKISPRYFEIIFEHIFKIASLVISIHNSLVTIHYSVFKIFAGFVRAAFAE